MESPQTYPEHHSCVRTMISTHTAGPEPHPPHLAITVEQAPLLPPAPLLCSGGSAEIIAYEVTTHGFPSPQTSPGLPDDSLQA